MTASNPNFDASIRSAAISTLLTVSEVAARLRLSRSKVYELVATRQLRAFRPGGRLRIPAESVRQYLAGSRV